MSPQNMLTKFLNGVYLAAYLLVVDYGVRWLANIFCLAWIV